MKNLSKLSVALFSAMAVSGGAYAGIVGSKHDLGTGGAGQGAGGTGEVCVFCHTPHGADTGAPAPLWNKKLASPSSFTNTRYSDLGTSTLDGKEAPVGSVSLACLSCHDGTQAMDVVINAPGRGGYNSAGAALGSGSAMSGTPIPNLGTDLRNDHPVSIQYAGGACQGSTAATCSPSVAASGDKDFKNANYLSANGGYWWVDTTGGTSGTREKTDIILYTRNDFTGATGKGPSVECASCHDPHNESTFSSVAGSKSVAFLRISNNDSDLCISCHTK